MPAGDHTLTEIMSQPEVWREALAVADAVASAFRRLLADAEQVIVTGCGSTYYLALTAARLLRHSGCDALACPASELLLYPAAICPPGRRYLLLAISRSGTTSETVRAQEEFKAQIGGAAITITCDSGSPLAANADLAIAIDAAQEQSVAQTRSFSSMALIAQQLAAGSGGQRLRESQRLPALCRELLESQAERMQTLAQADGRGKFFFLGADALYGIACEAMLKMKEMSLSYSEAYHSLEFRHGPMSMAGADSLVIGLISPSAARPEFQLMSEMAGVGATVLTIGQATGDFVYTIALPASLPAWSAPVLHLPALQLLAYYRALHRGCDPDSPHQLSAVISLTDI